MIRRALVLAAVLWATALPAARAQQAIQVVEFEWTRSGWRVTSAAGRGQPSGTEPDYYPPNLPDGTDYFELLGSDPLAVLARGPLADPGRATLDPEESGEEGEAFRSLEAEFARAYTQVRLPAEPAVARVAIRRARAGAPPETVFEGAVFSGAAPSNPAPVDPVGGAGLAPNRVSVLFACDGFLREDFGDPERGVDPGVLEMRSRLLEAAPFDQYAHLFEFARALTASSADGISLEDEPEVSSFFGSKLLHARKGGQPIPSGGKPIGFKRRVPELPESGWHALLGLAADKRRDVLMLVLNDPARQAGLALFAGGPLSFGSTTLQYQPQRFVHQMGHLIGGLGDEHTSTPPLCRDGEPAVANVGARSDSVPWGELIQASVLGPPIPGGQGCDARFHPTERCIMRSDTPDTATFCPVCREAIVDGLYARVRLPDTREPADLAPVVAAGAPPRFRVRANATERQKLVAEWMVDRKTFPEPSNGPEFSFTPPADAWAPGRHVVRLLIEDRTPVAGERAPPPRLRSMPQEVRWDVTVQAAAPAPLTAIGTAFTPR